MIWTTVRADAKIDPSKKFDQFIKPGKSFYRVADEIAESLKPFAKGGDAKAFIKSLVGESLPSVDDVKPGMRTDWQRILEVLNPSICVTTNYDLILEKLISKSKACCGRSPVTHAGDTVPIYHMHGSVLNPENLVLFEQDALDTMLPYSYASIKIPSLFYEYLTIMVGYGLSDANVSYFLGLSRFLGESISESHKLILVNWNESGAHDTVHDKGRMLVIDSTDVKDTLRNLLKDCAIDDITNRVNDLETSLEGRWNSDVQPNQGVNWGACAAFLEHVMTSLENDYPKKDIQVRHLLPTYTKWANEALGWCGFDFGMSYAGQEYWTAWLNSAKGKKQDLLKLLKHEAKARDLKALAVKPIVENLAPYAGFEAADALDIAGGFNFSETFS